MATGPKSPRLSSTLLTPIADLNWASPLVSQVLTAVATTSGEAAMPLSWLAWLIRPSELHALRRGDGSLLRLVRDLALQRHQRGTQTAPACRRGTGRPPSGRA
jgi:hypothetical protein